MSSAAPTLSRIPISGLLTKLPNGFVQPFDIKVSVVHGLKVIIYNLNKSYFGVRSVTVRNERKPSFVLM